jgi:hemolysin activation/secretion protein
VLHLKVSVPKARAAATAASTNSRQQQRSVIDEQQQQQQQQPVSATPPPPTTTATATTLPSTTNLKIFPPVEPASRRLDASSLFKIDEIDAEGFERRRKLFI